MTRQEERRMALMAMANSMMYRKAVMGDVDVATALVIWVL
jgi:hypothetical protein